METISLKLEKAFLAEIEKVMKKHNYTTKTEFIREAIRDKLKELEKREGKGQRNQKQATEIKPYVKEIPSYI